MPSYTIRYPHPVSKVTWHPVDDGIRITIFAATDEISPPKSPDLSAQETDDGESYECPCTPSAISLVVHSSGLDLFGQQKTSQVTKTAELVLPGPQVESTPAENTETSTSNSITILTPSSYATGPMYTGNRDSRVLEPTCSCTHAAEEHRADEGCECLNMDKLSTLQEVLAEERKSRPTLEERIRMPIVSIPRTVRTGTAIASFDLAFPELQGPQKRKLVNGNTEGKLEVSWEEFDSN
ncbi:hypothetical protein V8F20_005429 [Naviculisporaceae sp. PSN 640]